MATEKGFWKREAERAIERGYRPGGSPFLEQALLSRIKAGNPTLYRKLTESGKLKD